MIISLREQSSIHIPWEPLQVNYLHSRVVPHAHSTDDWDKTILTTDLTTNCDTFQGLFMAIKT